MARTPESTNRNNLCSNSECSWLHVLNEYRILNQSAKCFALLPMLKGGLTASPPLQNSGSLGFDPYHCHDYDPMINREQITQLASRQYKGSVYVNVKSVKPLIEMILHLVIPEFKRRGTSVACDCAHVVNCHFRVDTAQGSTMRPAHAYSRFCFMSNWPVSSQKESRYSHKQCAFGHA